MVRTLSLSLQQGKASCCQCNSALLEETQGDVQGQVFSQAGMDALTEHLQRLFLV